MDEEVSGKVVGGGESIVLINRLQLDRYSKPSVYYVEIMK